MGPPVRKVSAAEIRFRFNAGNYALRARIGELRQEIVLSYPLDTPKCNRIGLQPGTLSQYIEYYDGTEKVAAVHQYLQPDGTLGASQMPDPKELLVEGELWII